MKKISIYEIFKNGCTISRICIAITDRNHCALDSKVKTVLHPFDAFSFLISYQAVKYLY
jgi:hypothetical protein